MSRARVQRVVTTPCCTTSFPLCTRLRMHTDNDDDGDAAAAADDDDDDDDAFPVFLMISCVVV